MPNLIGQSIGRYHILEQLGEGGMATVYKAYDMRLERNVAIKVIRRKDFSENQQDLILKRFEREAKALAKLSHPNIVKVLDYGEHEGSPYLALEYLPGKTLKQRLGKPMAHQGAARTLLPIAKALAYAHKQDIIHRDVKPANILITDEGELMLSDFGIAKLLELEETIELTGTNAMLGTPEYMAPEQVTSKTIDSRADIYALGIVFYEMLTGRKPFQADTPMAVLFKHASEPLPRPRSFVPNLPQEAEDILFKALAKKPENRYQGMDEFAFALVGLSAGRIISKSNRTRTGVEEAVTVAKTFALDAKLAGWIVMGILVLALLVGFMVLVNRRTTQSATATVDAMLTSILQTAQSASTQTAIYKVTDTPTSTSALPVNDPAIFPTVNISILITPPTSTETVIPINSPISWNQGKLIYQDTHGIYALNMANDVNQAELILALAKNNGPYNGTLLSPDGSRIAFYISGQGSSVLNNLAGGQPRNLSACTTPSWSPDGSKIVCRLGQSLQIIDSQTGIVLKELRVNGELPELPFWSPSANEIVFIKNDGDHTSIWRVDIDNGEPILLTGTNNENYAPSWSPDGQWIAYQSNLNSTDSQIWIMDRDGRNARQITTLGNWSRAPAFSPDGKWLAFVSDAKGSIGADYGEVYIVSLLTGDIQEITNTGGSVYDWRVSWSR